MSFKKKELIHYIDKRISKKHRATNYKEIKDKLTGIYGKYTDELLFEEYETLKNNQLATQATSPENFTLGSIALISYIIAATSMYLQGSSEHFGWYSYIGLLGIAFAFLFVMRYRINEKSKELVYFNVTLEVIQEILLDRKLIKK